MHSLRIFWWCDVHQKSRLKRWLPEGYIWVTYNIWFILGSSKRCIWRHYITGSDGHLIPVSSSLLHGKQASRVRPSWQPSLRLRQSAHSQSHLHLSSVLQLLVVALSHNAQLWLVHGGHTFSNVSQWRTQRVLAHILHCTCIWNLVYHLASQSGEKGETPQRKWIYVTYQQ